MTNTLTLEKLITDNKVIQSSSDLVIMDIPQRDLKEVCSALYSKLQLSFKLMSAIADKKDRASFKLFYLFADRNKHKLVGLVSKVEAANEFSTLTNIIPAIAIYERRVKEFFGLTPVGHLDQRSDLLHENWPVDIYPLRKDFDWQKRPKESSGTRNFHKVEGEGIYEIPVGPVHAGIIEPGHFRFSVAGEEIILLEAQLGFKHKGVEKLFEIFSLEKQLKLSERVSGDTSFTHSLAFCQAVEKLADMEVPKRAKYLRMIYSELERLANHFNDIGFMMLDTGYTFGGSNGARLREMIMRLHEKISGHRFLRGVNVIGGVSIDLSDDLREQLLHDLEKIQRDFSEVISVCQESNSLFNRLKDTGILQLQTAQNHSVVGVPARAVGIATDTRIDFPYAAYHEIPFDMAMEKDGDVDARYNVRIKEVYSSIKIIMEALRKLPNGLIQEQKKFKLSKNAFAVGITEGWRGDIIYVLVTDDEGTINRVIIRDPSVPNWTVVGHSAKGNIVPDFPLINKSFDLSYSGNDL